MYNMYVLNACNQQIHVITCICSHINRDTYTQITYLGEGFTVRPKEWTCFFCEELRCAPHVYEMRAQVQRNNTSAREGSASQHPVCVCMYTLRDISTLFIYSILVHIYIYVYIYIYTYALYIVIHRCTKQC